MVGDLDVLVIGGASTDYLVKGPRLPKPGSAVTGDQHLAYPGGKGAIQAIAAARLGARVAFIGRVGANRRGDELLELLQREQVDAGATRRDGEAATGAALLMVGPEDKMVMIASGANHNLASRDIVAAEEVIARARVVLLQLEVPEQTVQVAARLAAAAGARVLLDPSPARELPEELLREVYLIRPNAREAQVLTGIRVRSQASARHAARNLMSRGVRAALMGAPGGNLLVYDEGEQWFPHLAVDSVDETGAGDALIAGIAAQMAAGEPLVAAVRFGTAAAALATTRLGALPSLPTRDDVSRLLQQHVPEVPEPALAPEPGPPAG